MPVSAESSTRTRAGADAGLLLVTFIWGASFPVVKGALSDASPVLFMALRFALALLLSLPLLAGVRRLLPATPAEWLRGVGLGAILAFSFAVQTIGLQSIGADRSAFITALYLIFVPLFAVPLLGRRPGRRSLMGVAFALTGLAVMTWDGSGLRWGLGESLTLLAAAGFAVHIIGVGHFTGRYDYRRLFLMQMVSATALLTLAVPLEDVRLQPGAPLLAALLVTGGLGTALAFYLQNRVQRFTTPTRVALIFSLEPVFAAVCTQLLDPSAPPLTAGDGLGAALIVAGVVLAELPRGALRGGLQSRRKRH